MITENCITLLLASLVLTVSSHAQNFSIPQHGFYISADDSVTVEQGQGKKIRVLVVRAKALADKKVRMGISSSLPEGVSINFEPQPSDINLDEAIIQVSPSAKSGSYFVVLSATVQYQTKGRVLKLIIKKAEDVQVQDVRQPAG